MLVEGTVHAGAHRVLVLDRRVHAPQIHGFGEQKVEAVGTKIITDAEVPFGPKLNIVKAGAYTFFAGSRSDAFFFDFDGIKALFDISGDYNRLHFAACDSAVS